MDDSNNNTTAKIKHPLSWLSLICLFQMFFWTLGPWLTRFNLHSDTLEGITWGNLWQWGYDKHPPLAAWLASTFANLDHTPDLPIYFFAQLCIVITFIAVWRLAREYLTSAGALLAVFLLQGILFYSNRVERFTPDTLQHATWALLVLFFYFAVTRQSLKYWLLTGIMAGLSFLTKYQVAVLFAPLGMVLLITREGRESLKTVGPWLGGLIALLIALPHLHWLYDNSFAAVRYLDNNYVDSTRYGEGTPWDHLYAPMRFISSSLGNVLLMFLLMIPLFRAPKLPIVYEHFKKIFLIAVATGPFICTLIFGAITGEKLVPRWATPYFAWLPLLMLFWVKPQISYSRFKTVVISSLCLGLVLLSLRSYYLFFLPKFQNEWDTVDFAPLRQEMALAEQLWNEHFDYPMPYLGGLHYHVAELMPYSKSSLTIPFFGLNQSESLWMDEKDFDLRGGIIVMKEGRRHSKRVRERMEKKYPDAVFMGKYTFKPLTKMSVEDKPDLEIEYYLLKPKVMR